MTDRKLMRIISEFLSEADRKFTMDRFSEWSSEHGTPVVSPEDIFRAADLFVVEGCMTKDLNTFEPGTRWRRDAEFLIMPTEREIRDEILIPGHRFIPFANNAEQPWNFTLTGPDGRELEKRTYEISIRDFGVFGTLLGRDGVLPYLMGDRPVNEERLSAEGIDENTVMEVTVFDLSRFLRDSGFAGGDALFLTVTDQEKGAFAVRRQPSSEAADPEKRAAFVRALDKAFIDVFETFGPSMTIPLQIALALYRGGKKVLRNPALHLGGYLAATKRVAIFAYGQGTILWSGSAPDDEENFSVDGALDRYLDGLGISLSETEIEAYMRDEFFTRNESFERVKERCFGGRELYFPSGRDREAFENLLKELWEEVRISYNYFTDQERGPLRSKALSLLDEQTRFIRSLDGRHLDPEQLPPEFYEAGEAASIVFKLLEILNREERFGEHEAGRIMAQLEQIELAVSELFGKIDRALHRKPDSSTGKAHAGTGGKRAARRHEDGGILEFPGSVPLPGNGKKAAGNGKPRSGEHGEASRQEVRRQAADPMPMYVLKVTLKGSKPPIWRRLRVPGGTTLGTLHLAVQAAMGWENYHLHCFEIGGTRYSDPASSEDLYGPGTKEKNELKTKLGKLKLTQGDTFTYEYDFGDGWLHEIKVEEVLSPHEVRESERSRIVCLKGKRACPPEDCGGVPGYEDMLKALSDPDSEEYDSWAQWIGEFDPEAFDLDVVNLRLAEDAGR